MRAPESSQYMYHVPVRSCALARPVTAYPTRISKTSTAVSADHAYTVLPIPLEVPNVSGPTCKHCSDMRWPCRHQLFARGHRWLLDTRSDAASVSTSNMPATAHPSIPETLGCTQQPCVESFPSSPIRPWQALSRYIPGFLWRCKR